MLIVSDVHGAFAALGRLAAGDEPLVVLGDLLNFVDYRDYSGLLAQIAGRDLVAETAALRACGDYTEASERWRRFADGREEEIRRRLHDAVTDSYRSMHRALEGAHDVYVTYGNVDRPDLLAAWLPAGVRFVDGDVVEIDGHRVGIVGGGATTPLGTPGEVDEERMRAKLASLGPVDILGTHVPPAVEALSTDVIGGRSKQSQAVLDYLHEHRPAYHYFGDVHQPRAVWWRVGRTRCINAGYFRATGRPVRHG